ncbi:HAD family phosphatase [Schleiferiaceae bacterium]|nr:HAD family phosphatase [Schleiferiaceae bacterium]
MREIKAILFDMDGVLIDAKEWHYEALNEALKLFGCEISRYDHLVTFDGLPTKDKLEMLSDIGKLPRGLHPVINRMKQKHTMRMILNKCKPFFSHQYALSNLYAEGYKMAVCSNSIRKSIEVMIEQAGLEKYFEFYVSNEDVEKGKPDPEMYTKAIGKLNLLPENCLILEDNENGIRAAKSSGAHVLQIGEITDLTYANIKERINEIEAQKQ